MSLFIVRYLFSFGCLLSPGDCENGPEEPVNWRKRSGEDVADAVHGGDLGVLVQRLHQGAPFYHVVLDGAIAQ